MKHTILYVATPHSSVKNWPAIQINDVFLAHPQLNVSRLKEDYEKAVIASLETSEGQDTVKQAKNLGTPILLRIGTNWYAPLTVRTNCRGQIIALLHDRSA